MATTGPSAAPAWMSTLLGLAFVACELAYRTETLRGATPPKSSFVNRSQDPR